MPTLLPCPFCAGLASFTFVYRDGAGRGPIVAAQVSCLTCRAVVARNCKDTPEARDVAAATVRERWNQRPTPEDVQASKDKARAYQKTQRNNARAEEQRRHFHLLSPDADSE